MPRPEIAYFAIGKDGFEAVANFGPVLTIIGSDQEHHTAVRPLEAPTPHLWKR